MEFKLEVIEDKIEFFESDNLGKLERAISEQIENNKALLLNVYSVSHQVTVDPHTGRRVYSAVVHFKVKK